MELDDSKEWANGMVPTIFEVLVEAGCEQEWAKQLALLIAERLDAEGWMQVLVAGKGFERKVFLGPYPGFSHPYDLFLVFDTVVGPDDRPRWSGEWRIQCQCGEYSAVPSNWFIVGDCPDIVI